ncbi:MAG: 16S rRNA (guanine(527)-N(7))-methyltransferase RsmG [Dehalococcoidia bacterium]
MADEVGVQLTAAQVARFERYLDLLLEANQSVNLTAVRDVGSIQRRHFLESLALGLRLSSHGLLPASVQLLDLGSGAGFPGLPLKIAWPGIDLTLLEATGKKARFLERTVVELQLEHVRVLSARAETLGHQTTLRESFDLTTARAVASLPSLIELALPFLKLSGRLAVVKGSRVDEELKASMIALQLCGGHVVVQEQLTGNARLRLVIVEKVAPTPTRFPRRPGMPAKRPLGSAG